ncbi:hypothetical protein ABAC460_10060 [Asticcacaulis sp. AC460]|uniref:hypothetical protein n=1 Tax=Asticcacaulis sp. AC460 TaxID=1282360 RepID=UPI0003C3F2E0|nr:hypothetical protein [Asticcacaulis sp. AC460]ESQ90101.1 hypothetical protein ABAC460_10060 [Asticcacaulis sp. AC460]
MFILTIIALAVGVTALAIALSAATLYHIGKGNEADRKGNAGGYWYYVKAVSWFWIAGSIAYGVAAALWTMACIFMIVGAA